MPGPKPQLVALLICDRAFREEGNRKWHVSGVFDTITVEKMPFVWPGFSVFVALSDFTGDAMVQLVVREQEGGVVKAVRMKVPRVELGLFQHVFPFPETEFRTEGVHTLELLADDELVALRSFRVQKDAFDPATEEADAHRMAEESKDQLVKNAREVWAEHPDARPVGLIASAQASTVPWFRHTFETVFGAPPPPANFVGIMDPPTTEKLLAALQQGEDMLRRPPGQEGRHLPVLVVMRERLLVVHFGVEPF